MFMNHDFFQDPEFLQTLNWLKQTYPQKPETFSPLELHSIHKFYQDAKDLLKFLEDYDFPLPIKHLLLSELADVLDYVEGLLHTPQKCP